MRCQSFVWNLSPVVLRVTQHLQSYPNHKNHNERETTVTHRCDAAAAPWWVNPSVQARIHKPLNTEVNSVFIMLSGHPPKALNIQLQIPT